MSERDWLDEIEAQADETSPYYLPRLIAEIRRLRAALNEVAELNQPNLEQLMALSIEVQELKAALSGASAQGPEDK